MVYIISYIYLEMATAHDDLAHGWPQKHFTIDSTIVMSCSGTAFSCFIALLIVGDSNILRDVISSNDGTIAVVLRTVLDALALSSWNSCGILDAYKLSNFKFNAVPGNLINLLQPLRFRERSLVPNIVGGNRQNGLSLLGAG